jgi:hypothetical protein
MFNVSGGAQYSFYATTITYNSSPSVTTRFYSTNTRADVASSNFVSNRGTSSNYDLIYIVSCPNFSVSNGFFRNNTTTPLFYSSSAYLYLLNSFLAENIFTIFSSTFRVNLIRHFTPCYITPAFVAYLDITPIYKEDCFAPSTSFSL